MRLLVLSAYGAHHFGKTIRSDGSSGQSSRPARWSVYPCEINDLKALSEIAFKIEADHPTSALVLGELSETGEKAVERGDMIYRRHNNADAQTNHIKDRAQNILFLDVEVEDGLDGHEAQERIEAHIKRLPECFHKASYHAQLSSTYGFDSKLRVHLFFWVKEAITCELWRAHLEKRINRKGVLVDHQPITASNAITMTRPIIQGMKDPYKQRSIFVEKEVAEVELPSIAYKIEPVKSYAPVSYQSTGIVNEDQWARETLEEVCRDSLNLGDGRNNRIWDDALKLGSLIGADRLNEHEVFERLLHTYEANGLIKDRSRRDVERSIRRGINRGKLSPNQLNNKYSSLPARSIRPKAQSQSQLSKPMQARSSDKEIIRVTSELISRAIDRASPQVISVAESMTGAGKSGALVNEAIKAYQDGGSVIYLARNHTLIEGPGGLLSRFQAQGVEPDVWRGRRRRCEEIKRLKAEGTQEALNLLNEYDDLLVESPIPRFCQEIACPLFETDQCTAWKATERPIKQRLVLAPQAYLSYLVEREEKEELPENLIIIIDERHDLIHSTPYSLELIDAFRTRAEDQNVLDALQAGERVDYPCGEFRALHQPVAAFALQLNEALNKLTTSLQVNQYGARERLTAGHLLSVDETLKTSAQEALDYIERANPRVKGLNLKELRKDKFKRVMTGERVRRSGLRIITDLAQLLTATLDRLHTLHLFVTSTGAHVERRVIQPLPKSSRIVLADATPTEEILGDYAQVLGFEIEKTSSEITPHPVDGLHIQTKSLRQSVLFKSQDALRESAVKSLNALAQPISLMLRKLNDGEQVGLICSKSLVAQINKGMNREGTLAENQLIKELSRFNLVTGYYGKDERGSNEFEKCKALVVLGEAKPNLGSAHADIESLISKLETGEDFDSAERFAELYREQVDSATVQAFGRLRSVWNQDLIFIHATEHTANLKGVRWSIYQPKGRALDQETQEAEKRTHQVLDDGGEITIKTLKRWGLTKNSAHKLIDRVSAIRPLKELKRSQGRGRPASVWFDPLKQGEKPNDVQDLVFNPLSQKCSSQEHQIKVAGERDLECREVSSRTDQDEGLVFNPLSQKWSSFSQLLKDVPRALTDPESYIYIKGIKGLNRKCPRNNDFWTEVTSSRDTLSPATYSQDWMEASL